MKVIIKLLISMSGRYVVGVFLYCNMDWAMLSVHLIHYSLGETRRKLLVFKYILGNALLAQITPAMPQISLNSYY